MNPLDQLGLSEVRLEGVGYLRRRTLKLLGASLADNVAKKRTDVQLGAASVFDAFMGEDDWTSSESNEDGDWRYYDNAGAWFGFAPEFSGATLITLAPLTTEDKLVIRYLPGPPTAARKLLFNLGPGTIYVVCEDPDEPSTFTPRVVPDFETPGGAGLEMPPQGSLHLLFDAVDERWLVW